MNLNITGRQFELTSTIKTYIENSIQSFEKYNLDIISIRCVIALDEKKNKKGFNVDFVINLSKKDTIVISQKDKDLYAAIDFATQRAAKVLRREHDKMVTHKNNDDEKEKVQMIDETIENADEIIPTELEIYKPLEIEEALEKLKTTPNMQFLVFNDIDAKLRVLYKRNDGKFGLY